MSITVVRGFKVFGDLMQKAGPYLLLEMVLPGGTLFALLLFLYRERPDGIASLWRGRHRERDGLEAMGIAPIV